MKNLIFTICGLSLLVGATGCATARNAPIAETTVLYRRALCPTPRVLTPEPCEITRTQQAARMRRAAYLRQQAIGAVEAEIYTSTPARPSGTGVSNFMPSPGACPPPKWGGQQAPGSYNPGQPLGPMPVAEGPGGAPLAVPVQGKPGFVVSPYSPNSGYVDVSGMAPGSEARDPYSGKVFRVP